MSDQSAASLEREANAVRSQVADTAEKLRDKMSPGQLIDEVAEYFRNSDGALALDNLKTQVRDNPLPLALVGAGLAWLFLGGGPTTSEIRERAQDFGSNGEDGDTHSAKLHGSVFDRPLESSAESSLEAVKPLSEFASATYSAVTDAVSTAQDAVSDASAAAKAYATGARHTISKGSSRVGRKVQSGFLDVLSNEPLVLGALGIAVGTAIGAMLPSTDIEDANVGPYRDKLRDEAEKVVSDSVEEAKNIASSTYETVKDEADRQGLSLDGKTIAERVADVGKAAVENVESSIREKVDPDKSHT